MVAQLARKKKRRPSGGMDPVLLSLLLAGEDEEDFLPTYLPNLALWLDDGLGAKTGGAGQFTAANSESLSVADNASQTPVGSFELITWVYLDSKPGTDMEVVTKFVSAGNQRSYRLYLHGSNDRWQFSCSDDGTANASHFLDVQAAAGAGPSLSTWYMLSAGLNVSDGTIGISVDAGTRSTGNLAIAAPHNGTAPLEFGSVQAGTANFFNGRQTRAALFNAALTAAERTWLCNGGAGRTCEEFGNASNDGARLLSILVSYWKMGEVSGTRADSQGSNNLTDNNTVTWAAGPSEIPAYDAAIIRRLDDRSASNIDPLLVSATSAPTFQSGEINGKPVIRYDGTDDVLKVSSMPAAINTAAGSIYVLFKMAALPATTLSVLLGSADEASTIRYFLINIRKLTTDAYLAISQRNNDTDDTVRGSTDLVGLTGYHLAEFHSSGTAWEIVLDGAAESLTVVSGSNGGDWFSDSSALDNFVLGGRHDSSGIVSLFNGDMADPLIFAANHAEPQRKSMRRWFKRAYNLTGVTV